MSGSAIDKGRPPGLDRDTVMKRGKWVTSILLVLGLLAAGAVLCLHLLTRDLPSESHIRDTILERYPTRPNATWVPLSQISPALQQAVITWEDPTFYVHKGFSIPEIGRSIVRDIRARAYVRGASTITQQVAKNMYLSPEKSLKRKLREAVLASRIEAALSKREILELYLNIAHWGPEMAGVEVAALRYCDKHADQLTWSEAALLTGILQNPIHFAPDLRPGRARDQQRRVLEKLLRFGHISEQEYQQGRDQSILMLSPGDEESGESGSAHPTAESPG